MTAAHLSEAEHSASRETPLLPRSSPRVTVQGKFLVADGAEFYLRGVTYGPFAPESDGCEYHDPESVDRDFAAMADAGINTVRVYTIPPRWLLDIAEANGLRVMVGLPWPQHVTFLDDPKLPREIEECVRAGVRACAGHPAVLCFAIGNEIPASIVRWHGPERIEKFLYRLYRAAKQESPDTLVTYVNYPTTEYLRLPFLDFICFNVYLETREKLEAYLARLQNVAGDLPLVLAEVGLDSIRNGLLKQGETLSWQIAAAFAQGCAGLFVFAWTDEWHRGGFDIDDWDFGLVTRDHCPKPALAAVSEAFARVPFPEDEQWPAISVVICSYNGHRTIAETLRRAGELDYPNYEIIVVNDGSTDGTAAIARRFSYVRLINQQNSGLSAARNAGMHAARGEIISYLDDDAWPARNWLRYVAYTFRNPEHAAAGGPNLPPPDDGAIAACVANAPGGPAHVLLTDSVAEHIPGCNFSVRKSCLEAIGGFDPMYRVAGDDVDVCWKLQERGWTLGFHAAAVVWHHRRNAVKTYLKQQMGYGKAEALLEKHWPEKYNMLGHVGWNGRVYGGGLLTIMGLRWRVYHGIWGSAPFQSLYQPAPGFLHTLPHTPEWHLGVLLLAGFSLLGIFWHPLLMALPLLALTLGISLSQAVLSASKASFPGVNWLQRIGMYALTAILFLLQPVARLRGRLRFGLTPWRHAAAGGHKLPRRFQASLWSEIWRAPDEWLAALETSVQGRVPAVRRGGEFEPWDLHLRGGLFTALRLRMAVEEHGAGKQFLRFCAKPVVHWGVLLAMVLCGVFATGAALEGVWPIAVLLLGIVCLLMSLVLREFCLAGSSFEAALRELRNEAGVNQNAASHSAGAS